MISLGAYARLVRENRNFRLLWLAQIVSEIGDWFYALTVYSLLLELTGRAELVGLAVVLQVLPQTLASPMAGVINDRLSRRKVMITADVVRAFIVLGMMFVRTPGMVWLVYPLLFLETLGWGFFEPGRSAVIPNITAPEDVILANTLSATTWSFNLAVGSTLGGLMAALLGRDAVFIANALTFVASALLLRGMRFEEPHAVASAPLRPRDLVDFSPILEGIRYVRRDPRMLATLLVKGGLGFLGANLVLLPLLGQREFPFAWRGIDPQRGAMLGMSVLMGARGMGALIGPLLTVPWAQSDEVRLRRGILFGFLAIFLGYLILGVAPSVWIACAGIVLAHGGGSTIWVFSTTLLQMRAEDRFRGRIFSAELGFNMFSISVTSYLAGHFIDAGVPVRTYVLITGASLLLPALVWARAMRLWDQRTASER
ncbi:MAG: MFS transporter [Bryobacteraceae bacterium]